MCTIVWINHNDSCETVGELKQKLNISDENIVMDSSYIGLADSNCLCVLDIPKTLHKAGIPFKVNNNFEYLVEK